MNDTSSRAAASRSLEPDRAGDRLHHQRGLHHEPATQPRPGCPSATRSSRSTGGGADSAQPVQLIPLARFVEPHRDARRRGRTGAAAARSPCRASSSTSPAGDPSRSTGSAARTRSCCPVPTGTTSLSSARAALRLHGCTSTPGRRRQERRHDHPGTGAGDRSTPGAHDPLLPGQDPSRRRHPRHLDRRPRQVRRPHSGNVNYDYQDEVFLLVERPAGELGAGPLPGSAGHSAGVQRAAGWHHGRQRRPGHRVHLGDGQTRRATSYDAERITLDAGAGVLRIRSRRGHGQHQPATTRATPCRWPSTAAAGPSRCRTRLPGAVAR